MLTRLCSISLGLSLATALTMGACLDSASLAPLDAACDSDAQCASGLCLNSLCLDPDADDDSDGLSNRAEGALGTNPEWPDSDGDGVDDKAEGATDSDGDGKPDAVESSERDADNDCIPDQDDPDDEREDPDACREQGFEGQVELEITTTPKAGVRDVVWDIEITRADGKPSLQTRLTTSEAADDGILSLSGPCDAHSNPNTVTVWVVGLYDEVVSADRAGSFNADHDGVALPALDGDLGEGAPLSRDFACVGEQEVSLTFSFSF